MDEQVQLMGVRQAAKVLGLNASTVSRYLAKYPDLVRTVDGKPVVDPEEVRRHRDETVNAAKSGNHAGQSFGEGDEPALLPSESHSHPGAAEAPPRASASLAEERAGFESIRRRREEIKFANELRLLADVAEVEDAGRELGGLLQREAEAVFNSDLVARIRRAPDDRRAFAEIEGAKDEFFKRLDNEAGQSLSRLAGGYDEEGEGPDAEE